MEIVTATLTGIALIKKSVDFIKENINTVNDISGIAKQIDGFFLGEKQMNKGKGKGMSIAEQFGSVENSANDFINMKLLEEQRNELKQLVNLRFGPTTWDEIIAERANRISEAKEASRLKRVEKRQQQKEIIDTLQTMGIIFCVIAVLGICVVLAFKSYAYDYKSRDYTRQQKIQQGKIIEPVMTTCRLMKQKVFKDKMACIYIGAQKTYEMEFTDISIGCPRKYKCKLNPNGKEPSIDKVMESLRGIAK